MRIGSKPGGAAKDMRANVSARQRQEETCGICGGNPCLFSTRRAMQRSTNHALSYLSGHTKDAVHGARWGTHREFMAGEV